MHDERFVTGQSVVSGAAILRPIIRGFCRCEIGNIIPEPFLLLCIPPDQFLALAPRRAIGSRRSTVVEDAAIAGPGESPAMTVKIFGLAFSGKILSRLGKDAGVNPTTARSGTIGFQIFVSRHQLAVRRGPSVYFLQNFFDLGF